MKEIMGRIQELAGEMTRKNEELSASQTDLRKKTEAMKLLAEVKSIKADLDKRQKDIGNIENIVTLKKDAEALAESVKVREAAIEKANQETAAALAEREALVEKGLAEIAMKQEGIDKQKEKLEEDRKNYKDSVLRSVQKDLDAAKK